VIITGKAKKEYNILKECPPFQGQVVLIWPEDSDNIFLRNDTCPPHYRTSHLSRQYYSQYVTKLKM
jgi:hypothetical protein